MKMAKERKKVRDMGEGESLIRVVMTPPIMDPREQIIQRTIKKTDDGKTLHIIRSVLDDEFPI